MNRLNRSNNWWTQPPPQMTPPQMGLPRTYVPAPVRRRGLYSPNRLLGELAPPAGSRLRSGFEFDFNLDFNPEDIRDTQASYISSALQFYLGDDVTFNNLHVAVQPRGRISNGYTTVSANTNVDLPSAEVFGDMVQYGIEEYLPYIKWTRRDATLIDTFGPAPQFPPETQQQQQQQNQNQPPLPPGKCNLNTQGFGDWVACQLGITSPLGGVAAGTVGALLGAGAITLIAIILLKKK